MMKIAVLSDTHSAMIPDQVCKALKEADLVIHAGDVCDAKMFKEMSDLNTVKAVYGNMDEAALRRQLPRRLIFKCEDVQVGVVHGNGAPEGLIGRVEQEFEGLKVDVIIFGHSHEPFNKKIGEVLFFNPGSPNDNIFAPYRSYGILEIDGASVKAKIIKVES